MKKNNIVKWNISLVDFPKTIYIEGLYDDYEGFRVIVRGEKSSRLYRISFDNYYIGYRNFDESERIKSIPEFPMNSREWCLFKSQNSDFINWLVEESCGIQSKGDITHYYIMTPNDIVEILCLKEPKVELL